MSEVFYRKWRPQRLDQVVGQEPVAQTLRNAVAQGRVAHAYLFCGPRGTGKTSTARIVAKAVNCLAPQGGEPDNECEICVSINESRALDLIEIDAASNRGIDDIRNLRDKVHFGPNAARHKVYIIDEVHMLTEPAFNALLKTLEEPPEHAIFVLATTEAHKVPLTIISRCQRFDFRRIPLKAIEARLAKLCVDEGIEASSEALSTIARTSAGSLRDAENLLEQALVSYGSPLSEDQVRDLLGLSSDESALELAGHILSRSVREGLRVINSVAGEGKDIRQFHRATIEYLRGMLLLKSGAESSLGYPEETMSKVRSLAEDASLEHVVRAMKTFAKADFRRDSSSPLPLELALVESSLEEEPQKALVAPSPAVFGTAGVQEPAATAGPSRGASRIGEKRTTGRPAAAIPPARSQPQPAAVPAAAASPARSQPQGANGPPAGQGGKATDPGSPGPPASEPLRKLESQWDEIVKSLRTHKGKRFNLGALLRSSTEREIENGTITLRYSHTSHLERMQEELDDPGANKVLKDAFAQAMDGSYEVRVEVAAGGAGAAPQSAARRSQLVRAAQAMGARVVGEKEEESE